MVQKAQCSKQAGSQYVPDVNYDPSRGAKSHPADVLSDSKQGECMIEQNRTYFFDSSFICAAGLCCFFRAEAPKVWA